MKNLLRSLALALTLAISLPSAAQILLTTQNTVNIRGEVTPLSMSEAKKRLFDLDVARGKSTYPIYLVLNTPGGDIDAGEDFIQFARSFKNVETITIFAASMGAGIVQGIQGKRHILPNGTLMFHRATLGLQGQVSEGEFESRLAYIKSVIMTMEVRNANRLRITLQDYKSKVKDELWYYGIQALTGNAADDLVSISCTKQLAQRTTEQEIDVGFFVMKVQRSECPTL